MEDLVNQITAPVKPKVESKPKQPGQGAKDAESGFRKALNEQRESWTKETAAAAANPETPAVDQTTVEGPVDQSDLELRMLLAAMSLAQNPVQPQQMEIVPQGETPVVPTVAEAGSVGTVAATPDGTKQPVQGELQMPTQNDPEAAKPQETLPQAKPVQGEPVAQKEQVEVAKPQAETPQTVEQKTEKQTVQEAPAQETPLFREVRAVPIQVGEAAPAEKAERPVSTQLGDRIADAIRTGETRVELELEPRNLGRVKIELVWHQDGTMHVMLQAEKAKTQMLLARDAGELQSILGRNGQQEVRVETPEYQTQQAAYHEQQNQQNQPDQQEQQEQQGHPQKQHPSGGESFLQQLRLGLIPAEELVF